MTLASGTADQARPSPTRALRRKTFTGTRRSRRCSRLAFGTFALLKERHVAIEITAAVGVGISALLGLVALVFALSFHW